REWAQVKEAYGWQAQAFSWGDHAAALVLKRSLSLTRLGPKTSILYTPRGPLLDWTDAACRAEVLDDLQSLAKNSGAIFIKIDPEVILGRGQPGSPEAKE